VGGAGERGRAIFSLERKEEAGWDFPGYPVFTTISSLFV
jgi:hypothetical protein